MTRGEALRAANRRLEAAGVEDAREDARRLLEVASDLSRAGLVSAMQETAPKDEAARFDALINRRAAREPLSQILGVAGFWTLELEVSCDVLSPRADSETLIEAALAASADHRGALRVLDIATGSGALLLALLSELPGATGIGTDISAAALDVARRNAGRTGLSARAGFVQTRWADCVEGRFDLLVCNPPYIASAVLDTLEPEVRSFEPRLALDGGRDGLDPYPHLFAEAGRLLAPGGTAIFEIGYDQGAAVLALAREAGARSAVIKPDLAGHDRALIFERF